MTDVELNESIQAEVLPTLRQLTPENLLEIRGALDLLLCELKPHSRENADMRQRWIRASALWIACNLILRS
jgi:hypothetical protein